MEKRLKEIIKGGGGKRRVKGREGKGKGMGEGEREGLREGEGETGRV